MFLVDGLQVIYIGVINICGENYKNISMHRQDVYYLFLILDIMLSNSSKVL